MSARWARRGLLFALSLIAAVCSAAACGTDTAATLPARFLEYCREQCDEGLLCVGGTCSAECSEDEASCEPLGEGATCRALEFGRPRYCDAVCTSDADCNDLGASYSCRDYHCRAGDPRAQGCRVAYVDYASGTTDIPPPSGCGRCTCTDATLACSTEDCEQGVPVVPCNGHIDSDTISKDRAFVAGNTLTLEVTHPGDCGRHDYAVCYADVSEVTSDVIELHVIHDGHGDSCDGQSQKTLVFDLSPLGSAYQTAREVDGGVVSTGYGTYGFGALTCEQRATLASAQLAEIATKLDDNCQTPDDCARVETETSCSSGCPVVASLLGEEQLAPLIAAIDRVACGSGEECASQASECDPAASVDCVNARCVALAQ